MMNVVTSPLRNVGKKNLDETISTQTPSLIRTICSSNHVGADNTLRIAAGSFCTAEENGIYVYEYNVENGVIKQLYTLPSFLPPSKVMYCPDTHNKDLLLSIADTVCLWDSSRLVGLGCHTLQYLNTNDICTHTLGADWSDIFVNVFATCGLDGRLCLWDINNLKRSPSAATSSTQSKDNVTSKLITHKQLYKNNYAENGDIIPLVDVAFGDANTMAVATADRKLKMIDRRVGGKEEATADVGKGRHKGVSCIFSKISWLQSKNYTSNYIAFGDLNSNSVHLLDRRLMGKGGSAIVTSIEEINLPNSTVSEMSSFGLCDVAWTPTRTEPKLLVAAETCGDTEQGVLWACSYTDDSTIKPKVEWFWPTNHLTAISVCKPILNTKTQAVIIATTEYTDPSLAIHTKQRIANAHCSRVSNPTHLSDFSPRSSPSHNQSPMGYSDLDRERSPFNFPLSTNRLVPFSKLNDDMNMKNAPEHNSTTTGKLLDIYYGASSNTNKDYIYTPVQEKMQDIQFKMVNDCYIHLAKLPE